MKTKKHVQHNRHKGIPYILSKGFKRQLTYTVAALIACAKNGNCNNAPNTLKMTVCTSRNQACSPVPLRVSSCCPYRTRKYMLLATDRLGAPK